MPRTARDRNLISSEPWEVENVHQHFPHHSHQQVKQALEDCKRSLSGSEERDKVMECLKTKLSGAP